MYQQIDIVGYVFLERVAQTVTTHFTVAVGLKHIESLFEVVAITAHLKGEIEADQLVRIQGRLEVRAQQRPDGAVRAILQVRAHTVQLLKAARPFPDHPDFPY